MIKLESITLYNADCMDLLRKMPDKSFDLAIVDCPYGIGESGAKNHSRSKIAVAKDYKAFAGNDILPPPLWSIFKNYYVYRKTKSFGERITLSAVFRMIVRAGLFGTSKMEIMTLRIANWLGLHSSPQLGYSAFVGLVCCKEI